MNRNTGTVSGVGMAKIAAHSRALAGQLIKGLAGLPQATVLGRFHCAHVLHHRLRLDGTLRASAHIYKRSADIEAFVKALRDL